MGLSAIIITKNEAANLADCLDSLAFADDIVVLDNGSTDGTPDIARAHGARVVVTPDWPGFGAQKNRALALAREAWVLSIDADERVSPALRDAILAAVAAPRADAYALPRRSQFCGRFVRFGGWYPDYVLRLFRRDRGRFSEDLVHEHVVVDGPVLKLAPPLLHYSYRTRDDVERKIAAYSAAGAAQLRAAGRHAAPWTAFLSAAWAYFRTLVLRLGLLDGATGIAIAAMIARTTYRKYRLLRAMQTGVTQDAPRRAH